jgi:hypothetical protein
VVARASNSVPPGTILCKKKLHKVQASAADFSEAEALRMALSDPIWMTMMVVRGLRLALDVELKRRWELRSSAMKPVEGDVNVATRHDGYSTRFSNISSNQ